jgi:hypothetical protein
MCEKNIYNSSSCFETNSIIHSNFVPWCGIERHVSIWEPETLLYISLKCEEFRQTLNEMPWTCRKAAWQNGSILKPSFS